VIRPEEPRDFTEIAEVVRAAFTDHGVQVATFVERIRASKHYVPELALVAVDSSGVVGHVMLSFVAIEDAAREQLLVLTPMSVRPDRQRRGVGTTLIEEVLRRAESAGEPAVLVEGIPVYYPRFGFERASPLGFVAPAKIPDEAFMVKRLPGWEPSLAGRVVYPASYDALG
jgi:putative acetyltransferase